MDRERGRACPDGSDPRGGAPLGDGPAPTIGVGPGHAHVNRDPPLRGRHGATRATAAVLVLLAGLVPALLAGAARAGAGPAPTTRAAVTAVHSSGPLVLLAQTPWVIPGQTFDLHLQADVPAGAEADLGVAVAVFPCLSSVSAFDQSVTSGPTGSPVSSTTAPLPVHALAALPTGGFDLPMPVVTGASGSGSGSTGPGFTIHLLANDAECGAFPSGVYPVRVQLVDTGNGRVLGSLVTHLVYTQASATTQRLRVAVVLPVQTTVGAATAPPTAALVARPGAAIATPSADALAAVTSMIAALSEHSSVPVTLQVSGQTVGLLAGSAHQTALSQLAGLAGAASVHELTAAPYTPVDAAALIGAGLPDELSLQIARGSEIVAAATGQPVPDPRAGLGAWITNDGLDGATVAALVADGYGQLVLPSSALGATPASGSTTQPFSLSNGRGSAVRVMASDPDLAARFTADPGDPVLAAYQLSAELAQLYYEQPNGTSPRAVVAVAPTPWTDSPAFVDTLLGSLSANPMVQPVTTDQLFSLFPTAAACRNGPCRLVAPTATTGLPTTAIVTQRQRVNAFAAAAPGNQALGQQLGDLVLAGEAEILRPAQQSAVLHNAGAAVDAQLGLLSVEGDQSITLTASSGNVPVTVLSNASYVVTGSLTLSSDKLLFDNGQTEWSKSITLPPRYTKVVYVHVRTRASGTARMDVALRSPDGLLQLATGEISVRSTATSVVGIVLSIGAIAVLLVWWVRTSRKRRILRLADESADPGERRGDP